MIERLSDIHKITITQKYFRLYLFIGIFGSTNFALQGNFVFTCIHGANYLFSN